MSNDVAVTQNCDQRVRQSRRRRRRGVALACVLSAVAVICVIYYEAVSVSRYKVIGKVDPKTGYHVEFTVSSHYRIADHQDFQGQLGILDQYVFRTNPPARVVQWLYKNVLHRPVAGLPSSLSPLDSIGEYAFQGGAPPGLSLDPNGYPNISVLSQYGVLSAPEHITVSGCPATSCSFDMSYPTGPNHSIRYYCLYIKPLNHDIVYEFYGVEFPDAPIGIRGEMLKVRDSIRIGKVK